MHTSPLYLGYSTDPPNTVRIEDALSYIEQEGSSPPCVVVCVTSIFTSRKEELLKRVTGDYGLKQGGPFLTQADSGNFTFNKNLERKAICVSIPIEERHNFVVNKIEIADMLLKEVLPTNWVELSENHNYFPSKFLRAANVLGIEGKPSWGTRSCVVYTFLKIFNHVCARFLSQNMIPFITSRNGYDNVTTNADIAVFNKPLRDRYAFINNAQLSHFIKWGSPLFTWQELGNVVDAYK